MAICHLLELRFDDDDDGRKVHLGLRCDRWVWCVRNLACVLDASIVVQERPCDFVGDDGCTDGDERQWHEEFQNGLRER